MQTVIITGGAGFIGSNFVRAALRAGAGRVVVACRAERLDALEGVPVRGLGTAGGDKLLGVPLVELRQAYDGGSR